MTHKKYLFRVYSPYFLMYHQKLYMFVLYRFPHKNIKNLNLEIVEMEEPGAARAVANLRLMYQGCMDTDAIEAAGLSMLSGAMENGQGNNLDFI